MKLAFAYLRRHLGLYLVARPPRPAAYPRVPRGFLAFPSDRCRRRGVSMKLAFAYLRRHLGLYLVALVFLAIEVLCDLAQPSLMALVVDRGVQPRDVGAIVSYGVAMVSVALGGAVAAVIRNNVSNRVAQTVGYEMRGDLYGAVQALSAENIDRLQTASVITRMTNAPDGLGHHAHD